VIDRRHAVLAVAVTASVATQPPPMPALFSGREDLEAGSVVLDPNQTRSWTITTTVVLPHQARHHDFMSFSMVSAELLPGARAAVSLSLSDCVGAAAAGVFELELDRDTLAAEASIEDPFIDCVASEPCTRTMCLDLVNDDERAVKVSWSTYTVVTSHEVHESRNDESTPVPIEITIEEIEP
jgi:hypothetical protein